MLRPYVRSLPSKICIYVPSGLLLDVRTCSQMAVGAKTEKLKSAAVAWSDAFVDFRDFK